MNSTTEHQNESKKQSNDFNNFEFMNKLRNIDKNGS